MKAKNDAECKRLAEIARDREEERLVALKQAQDAKLAALKSSGRWKLSREYWRQKDSENLEKKKKDSEKKLSHLQHIKQVYSVAKSLSQKENNNSQQNSESNNDNNNSESVVSASIVKANDGHKNVCQVCKTAFKYPSDLKKHTNATTKCIKTICKQDPPHDQANFEISAFLTQEEARLHHDSICPSTHFKRNDSKNTTKCKEEVPQKCPFQLSIRPSNRYLENGKFVKVFVVIGCKFHSHEDTVPRHRYCPATHEHFLIDRQFSDIDTALQTAGNLLDNDFTRMHRKSDCYFRYSCAIAGCLCQITLNYSNIEAITLHGCVNHNHQPRNVDNEVCCYRNHDHESFKTSFDSLEQMYAFIYVMQLDCEFKKQKRYETPTKFRLMYQCSRRGKYDAKIETKKNIGK